MFKHVLQWACCLELNRTHCIAPHCFRPDTNSFSFVLWNSSHSSDPRIFLYLGKLSVSRNIRVYILFSLNPGFTVSTLNRAIGSKPFLYSLMDIMCFGMAYATMTIDKGLSVKKIQQNFPGCIVLFGLATILLKLCSSRNYVNR